jgi:hypothetical protein
MGVGDRLNVEVMHCAYVIRANLNWRMFEKVNGERHGRWRAVDDQGEGRLKYKRSMSGTSTSGGIRTSRAVK